LRPDNKFIWGALIVVLPLLIATIFHETWLNKIGEVLVYKGPIEPAEAIVVLSGSGTGNRVEAGVRLFKEGRGKVIIMSGVEVYPGYFQHSLMKGYALKLNVPENKIIANEIEGENSTWGEAISNLDTLKQNKIKSFIVVTSAFHTNRVHSVYKDLIEKLGYDFIFSVYAAEDPRVPIKNWWKVRTAKKQILVEYFSTLNYHIEH